MAGACHLKNDGGCGAAAEATRLSARPLKLSSLPSSSSSSSPSISNAMRSRRQKRSNQHKLHTSSGDDMTNGLERPNRAEDSTARPPWRVAAATPETLVYVAPFAFICLSFLRFAFFAFFFALLFCSTSIICCCSLSPGAGSRPAT